MYIKGGFSSVYSTEGVDKFYSGQGANYSNPHRYDIERVLRKKLVKNNPWISHQSKILDLACGSGEITFPLMGYGYKYLKGTDPYTAELYKKQTNQQCDSYSFIDILNGCYGEQKFDCIICSYAMHLVKQSLMHDFCNKLAEMAKYFIIISPHKFPIMKETYGWEQIQASTMDKIHFRVFRSYNFVEVKENEEKKIKVNQQQQILQDK